ncbi:PilZ domain-containing protein [Virgibacillus sp. W0181]|uniref:PilZ domain-containing protein n=1 Tax=Virgibacillus sp. W0181 TaxID=3391581 RepID=UPI003F4844A6
MLYINIFQTVLIMILLVLYFYQKNTFVVQSSSTNKNNKNKSNESINYIRLDHRKSFRVPLLKEDCLVEFLEFENNNLNKLKNKTFNAHLENISIGGLKLNCSYDFPAKQSILIKMNFSLKGHEFNLKGKIVRKEEHNHKDIVSYGVQFVEVPADVQEILITMLNQIEIERRKKIS